MWFITASSPECRDAERSHTWKRTTNDHKFEPWHRRSAFEKGPAHCNKSLSKIFSVIYFFEFINSRCSRTVFCLVSFTPTVRATFSPRDFWENTFAGLCCLQVILTGVLESEHRQWKVPLNSFFVTTLLVSEGHKSTVWLPHRDTCVLWHCSKESPLGSFSPAVTVKRPTIPIHSLLFTPFFLDLSTTRGKKERNKLYTSLIFLLFRSVINGTSLSVICQVFMIFSFLPPPCPNV